VVVCCIVNSVASSIYSRYDPDVLRYEVMANKRRVEQLRSEIQHVELEMQHAQHGIRALTAYNTSIVLIRSIFFL